MTSRAPEAPADPGDVADRVVVAVTALDGVARMHAGMFGEVATYLPGRRVDGVRVLDDITCVHVAAYWDVVLPELARDIATVASAETGTRVHVTVEEIHTPIGPAHRPETRPSRTAEPSASTRNLPPARSNP